MARSHHIIDTLKKELRTKGINYRQLAKELDLSESTIKHMFSSKNFSLKRLDRICELLGIEMSELVASYEAQLAASKMEMLSIENERVLVSDMPLLLVAYCVTNHWSMLQILERYNINEHECIRCLAQLDRMKMIELLPENKIRLRISNNFQWHPNGPIEQFFRSQVETNFLSGAFSDDTALKMVKLGDLSDKSMLQIIARLEQVGELYEELSYEDRKQPFDKRHGTSMVLAIRRWQFHAFNKFEKSS